VTPPPIEGSGGGGDGRWRRLGHEQWARLDGVVLRVGTEGAILSSELEATRRDAVGRKKDTRQLGALVAH
jgi:hypothetical protein